MKIKVIEKDLDSIKKMKKRKEPIAVPRQLSFLRHLADILARKELKDTKFSYEEINMDKLGKHDAALFLMNHSSFIDLKITSKLLKSRPYHIICTEDGMIGKKWLTSRLGCIPTKKFVRDLSLIKRMQYVLTKLHSSVLMFPEASYTFDGTTTPITTNVSKCIKLLKVPVVIIKTKGAFLRDPLYNNLQIRETHVSATVEYILSKEDIEHKSVEEINAIIQEKFEYDHFLDQLNDNVLITEKFRADYLNRVLYKCPHCLKEGQMEGKGINITCNNCNTSYTLNEIGTLSCNTTVAKFTHIPTWYNWERQMVKEEVINNTYLLDSLVNIYVLRDLKAIYHIGRGRLVHTQKGFSLFNELGDVIYSQDTLFSYSLYSDFNWYELGDMICIGNEEMRYYCFPDDKDVVAKARLAQEESYKYLKSITK